jgi:hypothetical protein
MPEDVTYYAIVDDYSSRAEPAGVLRRFADGEHRDEAFGRDLAWRFSSLLLEHEHGELGNTFFPITEAEATQIVTRIRQAAE